MTKELAQVTTTDTGALAISEQPQFAPCAYPVHDELRGQDIDELGELVADPYARNVDDRAVMVYLCTRCYDEICDDI